MRPLRTTTASSSEMLLDTLCNVFGGVVLIACLLALMGPEDSAPLVAGSVSEQSGLLLERRIETARSELASLQEKLAGQPTGGDDPAGALSERLANLRETLKRLQSQSMASQMGAIEDAETKSKDPGRQLEELRNRNRMMQTMVVDAEAMIAAQEAQSRAAAERLEDLQKEVRGLVKERTVSLRFPREKLQTLDPFNVILMHGRFYPLLSVTGGASPTVKRVYRSDDSFEAVPIHGSGYDPMLQRSEVVKHLRAAKRDNCYCTLILFPDSFAEFRLFKELLHEEGMEYGVRIAEDDERIFYGTNGSSPSPL